MAAESEFIRFSAEKLEQLCGRIEDCLGRLSYDQVWMRNSGNENAVGNLVLHLCGNVTQWIGTGAAGRPDQRQRDKEFAARGDVQPAELAARIHAVVDDAASVIRSLTPQRLTERTEVQKYNVTVLEAVYHVVEHFSMHTGQILFATKLLTGQDLGYYGHLSAPGHKETMP
ncbi:MAG: DinB family protein [Bryobacteraceae bacterium]